MRTERAFFALAPLVALAAACGGRPSDYDASIPAPMQAFGLQSAAVVVDDPTHRALAVVGHADQRIDVVPMPVGHHVLASTTAPDASRLFVLASGDVPRRSQSDEYPSLTVIDATTPGVQSTRYEMAEPLSNLAVDPEGRYAAAFAGPGKPTSFVQNPNEIVLFDLSQPPGDSNPVPRTLRSFGGAPQRVTFTPTLHLPGGPRRLLVVETDRDVSLLDLDHAADAVPRPEITVRLTNGGDTRMVQPAGIVVDDGSGNGTDARIAVRTSDTNLVTLQLGAAPSGTPNDFQPTINLTDVGGIATDVAFVRTDGGLRVAALVGSNAVLVDPDTGITENVALPAPYGRLSIVTNVVKGPGAKGTDVALLWDARGSSAGVAFWTLGRTAGQPYRSVEVLSMSDDVHGVVDVPQPHPELKLLQTAAGSSFYVLDLHARTAAPLETMGAPSLVVSPDGARVWAFAPHSSQLASLDLATLHPVPLYVDRPIDAVFDFARDDGGRALVAMHSQGGVGVTVFDATAPDTATARLYSSIMLEGL